MHYVYILYSLKFHKLYIGFSSDLRQRLKDHHNGKVALTANWRPMRLIYYEAYLSKRDAVKREGFFKTGWGRNYVRKLLQNSLDEIKSSKI